MKNLNIIILYLSLIFLAACANEEEKREAAKLKSSSEERNITLAKIDSMEQIVFNDQYQVDENSTSDLMQAYMKYTSKYIGDKEKTPEFLYKAAALSRAVNLPAKAIKLYDQIINDYPNYERNPEVAFLMAFTYDEDIQDKALAKEAYEDVVKRYPGDMWSEQASERLKTIDMSDEEMIQKFMQKNNLQAP